VKGAVSRAGTLTAGLFRSLENDRRNFNDLLLGLVPNRTADHVIYVVPPSTAGSYSGEVRVSPSRAATTRDTRALLTAKLVFRRSVVVEGLRRMALTMQSYDFVRSTRRYIVPDRSAAADTFTGALGAFRSRLHSRVLAIAAVTSLW
jgi:hypothetical protein